MKAKVFYVKKAMTVKLHSRQHSTNWIKIIVIVFNSTMTGLTWKTITITLVEYGKTFQLSSFILTVFFSVQCLCAAVGCLSFSKTLKYLRKRNFLLLLSIFRVVSVIFCYIGTCTHDVTVTCGFFMLASIFMSLPYFSDYSLLLPDCITI